MKEILIINLTRMGDLLQTTPLMAGLKAKYADCNITLLVRSDFAEVCRGIPYIDDLMMFDLKGFSNKVKAGKHNLVDNYHVLESFINTINRKEYDLAVNITHSRISAILVSLIRTDEIRGFSISPEGHRVIKNPWVRYFFNVIPNRDYNPFHIVDIYLKVGDVKPVSKSLVYNVFDESEARARQLLSEEGIKEGESFIGFHLGASNDDKTWPVSSYAALADLIQDNLGAKILLFGAPGESQLAEELEELTRTRPVNLVGKTDIGSLAAVLKKCQLFISNDTGPLHVATSSGTRVIDISMANVHFMETGPYGEGHYVIQADLPCSPCGFDVKCNDRVCKSLVTPEKVLEVVNIALSGDEGALDASLMKDVQVYRSCFKEDGYLQYVPLVRRAVDITGLYRNMYRHVLNLESKRVNNAGDTICETIHREISASYTPESLTLCSEILKNDSDVLDRLVHVVRSAVSNVRLLVEEVRKDDKDIQVIHELWKKIEPLDNEIEVTGHTHPCLRPLTLLFMYAKETLEGYDLCILAEKTLEKYEDLLIKSENMLDIVLGILRIMNETVPGEKIAVTS